MKQQPAAVEERKVVGDGQPKKLVVNDIFKTATKQPEFPIKKAPVEPPKKIVVNPFEKKEEVVI